MKLAVLALSLSVSLLPFLSLVSLLGAPNTAAAQVPCRTSLPSHWIPYRATTAKTRRTESNHVLIYSIKSPCGQRLAKESALQNFPFNRIS